MRSKDENVYLEEFDVEDDHEPLQPLLFDGEEERGGPNTKKNDPISIQNFQFLGL